MNGKKLINPDDELWTVRRGAAVTINLFISHSRYIHGEIVVETNYRLLDGIEDQDPTSRIWLGNARRAIVTQLYDKLIDAVLIARGYNVLGVIINFPGETLGEWEQDFRITVMIVAHELDVPAAGILIPEILAHPGRLLNLSNDLARVIAGGEEDVP